MAIIELFSQRKKLQEKTGIDIYQYNHATRELRIQVKGILEDVIVAKWRSDYLADGSAESAWYEVHRALCREHGKQFLISQHINPQNDYLNYILSEPKIEFWLDAVELVFKYINSLDEYECRSIGTNFVEINKATAELNHRFRQALLGYQFENNQILKMDSYLLHSEVVKPALNFLTDNRFKGAENEFLSAHAHYRSGEYKDAILDANNAFESVMKSICEIKGWGYSSGARASDLIKLLQEKGLFPDYLDKSFEQLLATLKSGLPQVRNNQGGHGQGKDVQETPAYVASYALHLAATKIVFLVSALKAKS